MLRRRLLELRSIEMRPWRGETYSTGSTPNASERPGMAAAQQPCFAIPFLETIDEGLVDVDIGISSDFFRGAVIIRT
jgi:hypothetical protein